MAAALNSNAKTCFLEWFIERLEHGCSIDWFGILWKLRYYILKNNRHNISQVFNAFGCEDNDVMNVSATNKIKTQ